jgi:hypothetical protein
VGDFFTTFLCWYGFLSGTGFFEGLKQVFTWLNMMEDESMWTKLLLYVEK